MKKITLLFFAVIAFAFSFQTHAQCNYTLEMNDSYGDGWNGNTMDVLVNGTAVLSGVTLSGGAQGTMTFTVNDGDDVTTNWIGGGSYAYETSYRILDFSGTEVGTGAQTSITTGTITASCPTCTPTVVDSSTVVDDCGNSQFSVDVVVSTVGDGTNITDGLGGSFPVVAGTVTAGPYTNGDTVTLTVEHSDPACNFSLGDFETGCTLPGEVCENSIVVGSLPYSTTDDTSNYGDDYSSADDACSSSSYLNGDDVVYSFTPATDMSVNMTTSGTGTWVGLFVYEQCPFVTCVDSDTQSGGNPSLPEVSLVAGTTYYIVISTWPAPQNTAYTLDITENTCTAVTADFYPVNDCDTSGGFYVEVDVTDMGSATALTVSDDQGNPSQPLPAIGTLQFGPYVNGTDVVITIDDDNDDDSCTVTSSAITQSVCPPANDECLGAIELTVEGEIADLPSATQIPGTIAGATDSGVTASVGTANDDVWYSFTATATDINIDVTDDFDGVVQLFSGACGTLTSIESDDYDGPSSNPSISRTDFVVGETYYVRVYYYFSGTPTSSDFTIALWTPATLSIQDFDKEAAFTYYPNPVNNNLTLSAQKEINNVSVYNMVGQEVYRSTPNTMTDVVDMSSLQAGAYFVKVTVGNATKTVKVIKN
ncbi:T9SS type A sorting domain-containing protein [Mesoflavibacter sp. CH_XMU1422-2]|uniref:T9SS type A sorting domain-containing protein n=1 Tax=Mesoflavibacter sp. CH_XMU1422-2 TaxID=3107770 RepID=UPI003009109B